MRFLSVPLEACEKSGLVLLFLELRQAVRSMADAVLSG